MPAGTNVLAVAVTVVASAGFVVFVLAYAYAGGSIVADLGRDLGETLLEQGIRLEEAHQYERAVDVYMEALDTRQFDGEINRTATLSRLGKLLWRQRKPEQALEYLRQVRKRPDAPLSAFQALADCLLETGRIDEALSVAREWFEAAEKDERREQKELAKFYEGKAWEEQGNTEKALDAYRGGYEIDRSGFCAYRLGVFYYKSGKFDKALEYIESYLKQGTGDRADYARSIRNKILQHKQK